jgi:hypothetical protein
MELEAQVVECLLASANPEFKSQESLTHTHTHTNPKRRNGGSKLTVPTLEVPA